jgi:hypothetical protein
MTERESRAFFLGAAVAAVLFIGGSMIRDALSLNAWHSKTISKASYLHETGKERK